ncbi:MAG: efflux RND transporter permease subunit [Pseudomonadota bacterium]
MIRFFTAHPTAANLTMVLLMAVGILAMPFLLRETFPRIAPTEVQVTIPYPGATADSVARAICSRSEDALDGLRHLDEIRCDAFENRGVVIAKMRQGGDFARFTADVEAAFAAIDDFPETVEDVAVRQLGREDRVAVVAVTAEGAHDLIELWALAEDLKTRMERWGGIPQVDLAGFSEPQIRIDIAEETARALGLSLEDISRVIGRQNVDLPLGEVMSAEGSTLLRFTAERRSVDAYGDLIVSSSAAGGEVRLADVAQIVETVADPEVAVFLNDAPAAILNITKDETEDTLRVMDALRAFIADEAPRLPPGVSLTITGDTAGVLDDRLQMLVKNGLQGLLLVFAIIWLFFGVRQAFWIAAGLPVSFLGALAAMTMLGYSINMLTLVALLMVIGILMDDALVIAENIETKRAQGLPPLEAAVAGAWQVAPGVLASFVTTAAVFGALAFLEGDLGEILRVIPVVMLLVLVVSLVEAFLILPAHLSHGASLQPEKQRPADRWLADIRQRIVGPIVRAAVAWRWLTLGLAFLAFCASLAAVLDGRLKFQAFPDLDGDQIQARIALPAGAPIAQTQAALTHVLDGLNRVNDRLSPPNPGGEALVRDIVVTFGENADIGGSGSHLVTARIDLMSAEMRGSSLDDILAEWRRQAPITPYMHRLTLTEGVTGPAGRAVELRLGHDDLSTLEAAAADLSSWLARYAGTYNIASDLAQGRPELRFVMSEGAGALGLDARDVADQVRVGFQGAAADVIQADGAAWDIEVRLGEGDRQTRDDLLGFSIKTPTDDQVPLEAVAMLDEGSGYAVLRRIDGRPTITVTADVDTTLGNADMIVRDTVAKFFPRLEADYPGLWTQVKGASAAAEKTQSSMAGGLIIGLLIVFAALSIQLRSYTEPLVVMAIIPLAFSGAVAGHMALGIDISMPSMLGFASLAGIVVNDSILLVHVIKEERAKGLSVAEAAPIAALARFRAIFLTSVTTVAGVTPLLFETSLQAQPLIPMVTSIAFGLTATTVLILLVVPAFYAALDDLIHRRVRRRKSETVEADPKPASERFLPDLS